MDGGEMNNKCEWYRLTDIHYGCDCIPNSMKFSEIKNWNFCPMCGKEIVILKELPERWKNEMITDSSSDWVEALFPEKPEDEKLANAIEMASYTFQWFALSPNCVFEGKSHYVKNRKIQVNDWEKHLPDLFNLFEVIYNIDANDRYCLVRGILKEDV
jgi:hypothetical protein